jgi:hypothetical protein
MGRVVVGFTRCGKGAFVGGLVASMSVGIVARVVTSRSGGNNARGHCVKAMLRCIGRLTCGPQPNLNFQTIFHPSTFKFKNMLFLMFKIHGTF